MIGGALRLARFPKCLGAVAKNRPIRGWALVAFGANTQRPTIVCIPEDAIPATPGPAWLVFARDTDIAPAPRLLAPPRSPDATTTD
jgi:hypothetical protein